ncbi:hypothetical protein FO519_006080 [Halicephalobus sp. NKZ332]|nr:hypothetical protein FO519_006080 [Halicephalobus sp. NKZ332]
MRRSDIWIFGLLFCIVVITSDLVDSYTVTQYDRQWIDSLRHSAIYYHNLDWERRQRYRQLVEYARDQAAAPRKQLGPFFGPEYKVNQTASNIAKSLIYGRNFDII